MTIEQILIMAFGSANIALLTGIFRKIGSFEATAGMLKSRYDDLRADNRTLWGEINRLKERTS